MQIYSTSAGAEKCYNKWVYLIFADIFSTTSCIHLQTVSQTWESSLTRDFRNPWNKNLSVDVHRAWHDENFYVIHSEDKLLPSDLDW